MRYDVTVDAKEITQALAGLEGQIRFATSKAVNDVRGDAQRAIQDSLGGRFTLRRAAFVKRTIKSNREDFSTKEKLEAVVRVDPEHDFLAKFEDGGAKTPRTGRAIAIPTEHVRRTKAQIVSKSQRPRPLIAAGKAFSKAGRLLLKIGRGAGGRLVTGYVFKASVRIPKRLGFVDTATRAVDQHWQARATAAIERAVSTMR